MTAIDQKTLENFGGRAVCDMAAAVSGLLGHLGDRLGLYRAMAGAGLLTPEALAKATGTAPRYVREWLGNQAAGGYVVHRPGDGTFELPAEHAAVLADEQSPVFLGGAYEAIASCYSDHDHLVEAGFHTIRDREYERDLASCPSRCGEPTRGGASTLGRDVTRTRGSPGRDIMRTMVTLIYRSRLGRAAARLGCPHPLQGQRALKRVVLAAA
ncbi:hypothetical protein [Actinomadura verrucosospora]|uniref:S-adenosylmethionine-dependent methyltransferase Rv2258c-like winged HTH domain-containing protein n=1 Tax=Actinomadura verrucosospora TaxID=46165 RepID=A0A7D3VUH1_ACTVE|nr:hypothetical protein [Actinomadura verrucosospora]QKG20036.1 hypothetical protein ACTIVE_1672 [Actinomadura verrucosospora]